MAAAITNGDITFQDFPYDYLLAVIDCLKQVGVDVRKLDESEDPRCCRVQVTSSRRLKPVRVTTQPYPGFPTDLQAQMLALLCLADGNSIVTEKIFPDRFLHIGELARMGAHVRKEGPTVIIEGVKRLVGAQVMASDLRASAALVLAGLVAKGTTCVHRAYHIDRGYQRIEEKLAAVGATIRRLQE